MSSRDYRSDVADALRIRRQTAWPKLIEPYRLEEAELSFRVCDQPDSKVRIEILGVLARGGRSTRMSLSHCFPDGTPPDEISMHVFMRLHDSLANSKWLPPLTPVGLFEEDHKEEDEDLDEIGARQVSMSRDDRVVRLQSDAIKAELARRLASDVVDALERARRSRPGLYTRVGLNSGPGPDGEEAWIEILVVVRGATGGVARLETYVHPGAPPIEIDERIQEAIKSCEKELSMPKAEVKQRSAVAPDDDNIPF